MTESEPRRIDLRGLKKIDIEVLKLTDKISHLAIQLREPNMNYQISEIVYEINSDTKPEHIRELFSAIEKYNNNGNIKNIEEVTLEDQGCDIKKLLDLPCPAKRFKYESSDINDWSKLFKEILVALRSGTNFNHFEFANLMLFVDDVPEEGFKEFCEYFIQNNNALISLNCNFAGISDKATPHLTQLIRKSTALTNLRFCPSNSSDKSLYETLANSSVTMLHMSIYSKPEQDPHLASALGKLIGNSQKLEELTLRTPFNNILNDTEVKYGLKATLSLRKFSLSVDVGELDLSVLEANESITFFNIIRGKQMDSLTNVALRNKKLQNERVRSTIVLLYNIARLNHYCNDNNNNNDSSHLSTIVSIVPSDVWTLIMSHIKHPGVTLDFGIIARRIFSDTSIRRVIL